MSVTITARPRIPTQACKIFTDVWIAGWAETSDPSFPEPLSIPLAGDLRLYSKAQFCWYFAAMTLVVLALYVARSLAFTFCVLRAGLDEGILLLSLHNSWLYEESTYKKNCGDE